VPFPKRKPEPLSTIERVLFLALVSLPALGIGLWFLNRLMRP
jgi:hypothetical protein